MIEHAIIISLLCSGIYAATREGAVLGWWSYIVDNEDGNTRTSMFNPISECPNCMPSFWGVVYFCSCGIVDLYQLVWFAAIVVWVLAISLWSNLDDYFFKTIYVFSFLLACYASTQPQMMLISIVSAVGANYLLYCKFGQ